MSHLLNHHINIESLEPKDSSFLFPSFLMDIELPISLFLRKEYSPHFLDLSGEIVFDFHLDIKRGRADTDPRDLTLLTNDSVFDIPYAFQEGLLELRDWKTDAVILWPPGGKLRKVDRNFITLPLKSINPKAKDRVRSVAFNAVELFRGIVQPGRQYKIWLRDLDCHVKWWSFSSPPSPDTALPASNAGRLVSQSVTNTLFQAVSSIRSPPPISIAMSLSSPIISDIGPLPSIRVEITNLGEKTITIKSSGQQFYTSTENFKPHDALITSPASTSQLQNFTITSSTGQVIVDIRGNPNGSPNGLEKKHFVTLEPGLPMVVEKRFWEYEWLRKSLRQDGGGTFKLALKRKQGWWCEGSVANLFGERDELDFKQLWASACLPVILEAESEVEFRFVA